MFSAYTNMTSSSPMKGFNYYFQEGEDHIQPQDFHFQDENIAPMGQHDMTQFGSGLDEIVPVSQSNNVPLAPTNRHQIYQQYQPQMLQMAPKFEISQVQQNFLAQHEQTQMPPPSGSGSAPPHVEDQKNLYPAMHIFQHQPHTQGSGISQSASTNTLASFESAPGLTVSHSASDNSMSMSPMSFQNQTPRRVGHRRLSNAITPLPQVFESPIRSNTSQTSPPVATRSQSQSSLHVSTQTPTAKLLRHRRTRSRLSLDIGSSSRSPSGTNPFYSAFMSPHQQSPSATPFQTPHRPSVSPNVLMNPGKTPVKQDNNESDSSMFTAAANFTLKMASQYNDEPKQLVFHNMTPSKPLARSQSSIDLASIAIKATPPELTRFDILEPRRKKQTTMHSAEDAKAKKLHNCPLCGSSFHRPEHVKRHLRAHSSEKPFQCDEPDCGKRFNRLDNMRAHLRKIHHKNI